MRQRIRSVCAVRTGIACSLICTGLRSRVRAGKSSTFLPLITAASLRSWPAGLGLRRAGFRCSSSCWSRRWPRWSGRADYAGKLGILADETYGQDALNAATGRGWWIGRPVELPGSNPLQFEHGRSIGTNLISWPKEHVAKCLVFYHPDDPDDHRLEQEAQVRALYEATQASGHELLLEIIPPKDRTQADTVYRSLKQILRPGHQAGVVEAGVDDGRAVALN